MPRKKKETKLSLKAIGVEHSQREKEIKEHIIYLRNKIIAHSSKEEMEYKTYNSCSRTGVHFVMGPRLSPTIWPELQIMLDKIIQHGAPKIGNFADEQPERFARSRNWQ